MDWEPRVGMRVVCVNANDSPNLERGKVYTISRVELALFHARLFRDVDHLSLSLAETCPLPGFCGFSPRRFRPLDEHRLDVFRAVLTKAPTEKEPA